jgi:hypothetical protein
MSRTLLVSNIITFKVEVPDPSPLGEGPDPVLDSVHGLQKLKNVQIFIHYTITKHCVKK